MRMEPLRNSIANFGDTTVAPADSRANACSSRSIASGIHIASRSASVPSMTVMPAPDCELSLVSLLLDAGFPDDLAHSRHLLLDRGRELRGRAAHGLDADAGKALFCLGAL